VVACACSLILTSGKGKTYTQCVNVKLVTCEKNGRFASRFLLVIELITIPECRRRAIPETRVFFLSTIKIFTVRNGDIFEGSTYTFQHCCALACACLRF